MPSVENKITLNNIDTILGGNHRNTRGHEASTPERKARGITWVDAAVKPSVGTTSVLFKLLTSHIIEKDDTVPFPLEKHPHLQLLERYCESTSIEHELAFRHIFEQSQHATRDIL
jgi:hypothetical protein